MDDEEERKDRSRAKFRQRILDKERQEELDKLEAADRALIDDMREELNEAIFTAEGNLAMGRNKDVFKEAVDAMQKKLNEVPLNVPITEEMMDELRAAVEAEVKANHQRKIDEITQPDNVNHPAHYTTYKGVEVIDLTEQMNFNKGNAVKYICRAGLKSPETEIEDLRKAKWYLDREIERLLKEKNL